MRASGLMCMLAVIVAAPCYGQLERVDALDFFSTYAGPIVYIEVADSQVLVFDASKNDVDGVGYVLHGRPLEIHAKNVEVTGEVVVRSFTDKEHGADAPPAIAPKPRLGEQLEGRVAVITAAQGRMATMEAQGTPEEM